MDSRTRPRDIPIGRGSTNAEPMIHASMATIKGREDQCNRAYGSLLCQLDIAYVSIQDAPHEGREDDARKFLGEPDSGYMLTVDDDLIYPFGYVQYMRDKLDLYRFSGPCVVSLMGRVVFNKIDSYYRDRENAKKFDWRNADDINVKVDIPGTGVMIYHTDDIRFTMDDFPTENMADIHVGIKCKKLGIPIYRVPPPRPDWIKYQQVENTIWDRYNLNDQVQTDLVNENF